MTVTAVAAALRAGVCSDEHRIAAVELLIDHQHWLTQNGFVSTCILWGDGRREAWIDFDRAIELLDGGELRGSSTERLILRIAASIDGVATTVRLSDLCRLDRRNARLVHDTVGRACGRPA